MIYQEITHSLNVCIIYRIEREFDSSGSWHKAKNYGLTQEYLEHDQWVCQSSSEPGWVSRATRRLADVICHAGAGWWSVMWVETAWYEVGSLKRAGLLWPFLDLINLLEKKSSV